MAERSSSFGHHFLNVSGNFFFRFRNALFPVVFVLLFLATRPALFLNNPFLDRVVVALGIAMALLGQGFRLLVIGFAYIKRGGKDYHIFAKDLVIEGFYAYTRNPMYVGNLFIIAGLSVVYGSIWSYVFVIPFFIYAYLSIVVAEETYLSKKFGIEYEAYVKRVNRFWPDFSGPQESLQGYHYDWKKALRKDYGTVLCTLLGLTATLTWKLNWIYGFAAVKQETMLACGLGLILTICYGIVFYLKRAGRLT